MAQNNDVDVNTLIKIYNNKISTLTNQNILLEAKLQTIVQDHLDAQKELMAEKLEYQEKYENLLAEIEEEEDGEDEEEGRARRVGRDTVAPVALEHAPEHVAQAPRRHPPGARRVASAAVLAGAGLRHRQRRAPASRRPAWGPTRAGSGLAPGGVVVVHGSSLHRLRQNQRGRPPGRSTEARARVREGPRRSVAVGRRGHGTLARLGC